MTSYDAPSDPLRLLRAVRRRLKLVLICVLLLPASALAFSLLQGDEYSATATLHFRESELDEAVTDHEIYDWPDEDRVIETNLELASLDRMADRTARALGSPWTGDEVGDSLSFSAGDDSDLISVTAEASEPEDAQRVAGTFAEEFVSERQETDRAFVRRAIAIVEDEIDALPPRAAAGRPGTVLRERLRTLRLLARLESGNVEIAEEATLPSEPDTPGPLRNVVIGLFLGMMLGLSAVLVVERIDRRLGDSVDVEDTFRRPLLAEIPPSDALRGALNGKPLPPEAAQPFRELRTTLRYFDASTSPDSLLITSVAPGEGKTTVAWNLAAANAVVDARVLLIEADLWKPALAERLGLPPSTGLSGILTGDHSPKDAIRQVPVADAEPASVDVIAGGPPPPAPADLLDSSGMRELVAEARRDYDLVVIDGPATSQASEAIPLVPLVRGVVVVAGLGRVTRDAAAEVRERFADLGSPPLGVVVNHAPQVSDGHVVGR